MCSISSFSPSLRLDPVNNRRLFATNLTCNTPGSNPNVFLGTKYGVTAINVRGCSNNIQHIGFDHLGRPHQSFGNSIRPNHASYINQTCRFTFTLSDGDTFSIDIAPETGYAYIVNQPNS